MGDSTQKDPANTATPIANPAGVDDNSSAPPQTAAPATSPSISAPSGASAGTTAPEVPGANAANSAQPIPPSGPVAGSTPAAGPTPVAGQDMSDQSKKHSMAEKVLSGLMGGKPTGYVQTDKGPVPVKRDWQPGELARHVVASAASLLAAGIGGEQAAKNKRPFELAPGSSLGDIKDAQQEKDKADAQAQFENKQNTDKLKLQQEQGAREQQDSMIRKGEYDMAHQAWDIAHANDDLIPKEQREQILSRMQDQNIKMSKDYQSFLTMPGSKVMTDDKGQELNFNSAHEAQAYVHEHPDVIHGMTNGKSKFGVVVVANPWTGQTQLIDFPADRHETGLNLVGVVRNKAGDYVTDKDGVYIAYGTDEAKAYQKAHPDDYRPGRTVLGYDGKPTYLTGTVTPDQVSDLYARDITEDKIRSQINDVDQQAKLRDAEVNKYPELRDSMGMVEAGAYNLMTDKQRDIAKTFSLKQEAVADAQQKNAEGQLLKLKQAKAQDSNSVSDDEIKEAQDNADRAKDEVDDWRDKYNNLSGNTVGKRFANQAIRQGNIFHQPWSVTDAQISAAPMSAQEQQIAKDTIYNNLTPAQRAYVNPTPQTQAKAAEANQQGANINKPHKPFPAGYQVPAGLVVLYDPDGKPHGFPQGTNPDTVLATPKYKGWTK